jgi:inhibitor of cysteine peptidase
MVDVSRRCVEIRRTSRMSRTTLAMALATALAALSSACAPAGNQSNGSFTEADSGRTFTTSPGASFDIRLKGNYTTGYSWNVADCDKNIVQLTSSQYIPAQPQLVGSGGVQHYLFKVVGKGQTTLKIIYHRVWEKNAAPAQTFTLRIDSK